MGTSWSDSPWGSCEVSDPSSSWDRFAPVTLPGGGESISRDGESKVQDPQSLLCPRVSCELGGEATGRKTPAQRMGPWGEDLSLAGGAGLSHWAWGSGCSMCVSPEGEDLVSLTLIIPGQGTEQREGELLPNWSGDESKSQHPKAEQSTELGPGLGCWYSLLEPGGNSPRHHQLQTEVFLWPPIVCQAWAGLVRAPYRYTDKWKGN